LASGLAFVQNWEIDHVWAALVIGAGGTARAAIYALQSLRAEVIYIYNRTASKARDLAHAFPNARIKA
jgi:pentafunctional AROM polypeptide